MKNKFGFDTDLTKTQEPTTSVSTSWFRLQLKNKKTKRIASYIIGTVFFLAALIAIYDHFAPSAANLDIAVYGWNVDFVKSNDNTTIVGFNVSIQTQITNTGKLPAHIVICDVYPSKNGKPVIDENASATISEIMYLKPQDSLSYNYTKFFTVSTLLGNATEFTLNDIASYYIYVGYRETSLEVKQIWKEVKGVP